MPSSTPTAGAVSYRGAPLFQPISTPMLSTTGYDTLKRFTLARARYLSHVEERQSQPGGSDLRPQSLKQSLDPELLDSLLFLDTFGSGITTPSDVTDSAIQEWIDGILGGTVSLTKADLDQEVKSLRCNTKERDPEQRVVQLFIQYHGLLRRFHQQDFPTNHPKDAVAHIVSRLHPLALKTRVAEDLAFAQKALRKDFKKFFTYVKAEAV